MAELTESTDDTAISTCCAPAQQATCCEPSEKADCCSAESSSCGCSAGRGEGEAVRSVSDVIAGSAIIRARKAS